MYILTSIYLSTIIFHVCAQFFPFLYIHNKPYKAEGIYDYLENSKLYIRRNYGMDGSMTLTELYSFKVTKEMKAKMQQFDNINWSAWIRTQITRKLEDLEKVEKSSNLNFCPQCGKRLFSADDKFCRLCGARI
jgi:ribosomal protein S27AE